MLGAGLGVQRRAVGMLFSPSYIDTTLWYDSADSSTITESAGAVSQWDDKSGNSYHMTQGTGSRQPTTGVRTMGGRNAIDFDGTQLLKTADTVITSGGEDISMMMLIQFDLDNTFESICDGGYSGTSRGLFRRITDPARMQSAFWGGGLTPPPIPDGKYLFMATDKGEIWNGGELVASGSAGTHNLDRGFSLGANYANVLGINGVIAEFILTNETWTTDTRQKMEGYMAWKWGQEALLSIGHPYKLNPPTIS